MRGKRWRIERRIMRKVQDNEEKEEGERWRKLGGKENRVREKKRKRKIRGGVRGAR